MALINELVTPACLIDSERLQNNARRVSEHCEQQGVALRPHVKTLKSLEAAQIYAPVPMPVTVSTLAEARVFAQAGYSDILYAVGLTPNKLAAVYGLLESGVALTVITDSLAAVRQLVTVIDELEQPLPVAIEIDTDGHRAGITPESPDLVAVARLLAECPSLSFAGVMAHAGASYGCFDEESRNHMAQQECDQTLIAVARLEDAGFVCGMVSVGSTPTVLTDVSRQGITELRAGVYATFDLVMAGLGVCSVTDIAMSVVTCVIGQQPDKGWVLVDAGWMALSRDQGTSGHANDCGYGLVCDIQGNVLNGWYVSQTNQEHGIIQHVDGRKPDAAFAYGTMLRILPVHACATAGQFDRYLVTEDNQTISTVWQRVNGWE